MAAIDFPNSPSNGQEFSADGNVWVYNSTKSTWSIKANQGVAMVRTEITATAGQTSLSVTYNPSYGVDVTVNGIQLFSSDFTATNGTSITMTDALAEGDQVVVMAVDSGFVNLPSDISDLTDTTNVIPADISDLTDTTNVIPADISDLTDTTDALSSGGGLTVYNTIDDIPSSADAGSLAFINENQRLLVYANAQWVSVELSNAKPVISGNNASYDLATDGTATVVTLSAVDPEGADITWSYTTSGLGSIATVSQNVNVFTITPSTSAGDSGTFSITFRASDGETLGTSTSEFTLDLFIPEYYPNENEGFFVDFTDTSNMFQDLGNTASTQFVGNAIGSIRQSVDFGGSASYLIANPAGDSDGDYTDSQPTLGNDGTRFFAYMGNDQAYRLPTLVGDFDNCIFCVCAKNFNFTRSNSRMFSIEGAGITGNLSIGIAGSGGQLWCKISGTANTFSVDSTNGITLNGITPTVITVVIQGGVASFRENKVDLGNSGGGGPTSSSSRGCVFGGGYSPDDYQTTHDTYGAAFAYGTFTTADIEAFENRLAALAGITI